MYVVSWEHSSPVLSKPRSSDVAGSSETCVALAHCGTWLTVDGQGKLLPLSFVAIGGELLAIKFAWVDEQINGVTYHVVIDSLNQ